MSCSRLQFRGLLPSFRQGSVGTFSVVCPSEFTKFTQVSETDSATPNTVDFGIVKGSSLKFATRTRARSDAAHFFPPPDRSVTPEGCCVAVPTRVGARANRTPCIGIRVGSTHTNDGRLSPFSASSLPVAT